MSEVKFLNKASSSLREDILYNTLIHGQATADDQKHAALWIKWLCLFLPDDVYEARTLGREIIPDGTQVLVPMEPPEVMWDGIPRQIVMWMKFADRSGKALHAHLKAGGYTIPEWLVKEIPPTDQVPPKGTVAVCIFKAMIEQRPKGMP